MTIKIVFDSVRMAWKAFIWPPIWWFLWNVVLLIPRGLVYVAGEAFKALVAMKNGHILAIGLMPGAAWIVTLFFGEGLKNWWLLALALGFVALRSAVNWSEKKGG